MHYSTWEETRVVDVTTTSTTNVAGEKDRQVRFSFSQEPVATTTVTTPKVGHHHKHVTIVKPVLMCVCIMHLCPVLFFCVASLISLKKERVKLMDVPLHFIA